MAANIKMVEPEDAEGQLKELYARFNNRMANILKVHSLNPASLEAHLNYYKAIMFGSSPLSRKAREMIAVVVSAANGCRY